MLRHALSKWVLSIEVQTSGDLGRVQSQLAQGLGKRDNNVPVTVKTPLEVAYKDASGVFHGRKAYHEREESQGQKQQKAKAPCLMVHP